MKETITVRVIRNYKQNVSRFEVSLVVANHVSVFDLPSEVTSYEGALKYVKHMIKTNDVFWKKHGEALTKDEEFNPDEKYTGQDTYTPIELFGNKKPTGIEAVVASKIERFVIEEKTEASDNLYEMPSGTIVMHHQMVEYAETKGCKVQDTEGNMLIW